VDGIGCASALILTPRRQEEMVGRLLCAFLLGAMARGFSEEQGSNGWAPHIEKRMTKKWMTKT
jgi:hypothetical protein